MLNKVLEKIDSTTPNTFTLSEKQSMLPQAYAQDSANDYDQAQEYIVIDNNTGNVLSEKNSQNSVAIASLTKLMTAVVALDLARSTDKLTISQAAGNEIPTTIGVVPGQHMTVDELLYGMLMTSANDAAQAVKDGIDATYGSEVFISAMNEKAKMLGLTKTHFANPQGFDNVHNYSSAHDLAVLAHYALTNYPEITQIVKIDFIHMDANAYHKQFDLNNWNGLLDVYPGAYGVKIGNTGEAGYTTIVTSQRNGIDLLVVVLDAPGIIERDQWAAELLDSGFAQYSIPAANITKQQLLAKYATWKYFN
ncbi:MAG: D-alanyl-D-alanine carboxypeptidase [Patescibacteria group bacterium]|nr:D-alanyl-D-alanine carboxypeptidase [Patescibacteria group bacterium]